MDNGRSRSFRRNTGRGKGNTFRAGKKTQFSSSFNRSNPIASDGSVMRCHNCDSIKHFLSAGPHRKVEESNLTAHVTLLTGETNSHHKETVAETLGKGILDSACTKTDAAKSWLDQFVECLDAKQQNLINKSEMESSSLFRFGDGVESKSLKQVKTPVLIGEQELLLDIDVADNDISWLTSKPTMTKMGMKIDLSKNEVTIGNQRIKIEYNKSSNYVLPLLPLAHEDCKIIFHLESLVNLSKNEKERKAVKLHRKKAF